ncbi:MAG: D-alanine--D-alanine ligase [Thermodesulfovibrionia bacterium]|nr:D-alanine--D-alanine ligase [Thermodesulfovibrionia bacterium]
MTKGQVTTKRIGVLMGGFSSERDVSIRSGLAIYQALQELGYNSVLIDVGKEIVNVLKKEKVKLAFLALHGGIGENGAIQGMLEVLEIPYTGSGVLASALAMDKEASKKIFMYHGLPVAPFVVVQRSAFSVQRQEKNSKLRIQNLPTGQAGSEPAYRTGRLRTDFEMPWVVKPVAEGSSIGISIVKEQAGLVPALEKAFLLGKRAIIEKFVEGKEVHIGILGSRALGGVEIKPSLEFYNYEAKYTSGLTEYIIPPQIEEAVYEKAKNIALNAHTALGCSGATRVDLRIDENATPYVLEVNTLPGMTATSLLPKIAQSAGLSFKNLIEEIIRLALKE